MYTKILVPLDASSTAQIAAEHAVVLARDHHAAVRFLTVIDFNSFIGAFPNMIEVMSDDARQILDGWMEKASRSGLVASTAIGETNLENASVADVIAADANAWGADLIVFGSDGHESVARRILGSVADGVARLSAIRVLTVPLSHTATAS